MRYDGKSGSARVAEQQGLSRTHMIGQTCSQAHEPRWIDATDDPSDLRRLRRIQVAQTNHGCLMQTAAGEVSIPGWISSSQFAWIR
jgi:hypothetical protein